MVGFDGAFRTQGQLRMDLTSTQRFNIPRIQSRARITMTAKPSEPLWFVTGVEIGDVVWDRFSLKRLDIGTDEVNIELRHLYLRWDIFPERWAVYLGALNYEAAAGAWLAGDDLPLVRAVVRPVSGLDVGLSLLYQEMDRTELYADMVLSAPEWLDLGVTALLADSHTDAFIHYGGGVRTDIVHDIWEAGLSGGIQGSSGGKARFLAYGYAGLRRKNEFRLRVHSLFTSGDPDDPSLGWTGADIPNLGLQYLYAQVIPDIGTASFDPIGGNALDRALVVGGKVSALRTFYVHVNSASRTDRIADGHIGFEVNAGAAPRLREHLAADINVALVSAGKALTDAPSVGAALTTQIKLVF